jgi:predicted O-methyltransferase YrrM
MNITKESLELTRKISDAIGNQTFHHHYHILYDIAKSYDDAESLIYVEIGCYAGGSACLMLQRPKTEVISIDLGKPISKYLVFENVNKLNIHSNRYEYIEGSSHESSTVKQLENLLGGKKIDILFIDGDHSYNGVQNDFKIYSKFGKENGFIVFDDYNDYI